MSIGNKIKKTVFLEIVKWIGSITLLLVVIIINYVCCDYSILIRELSMFFVASVAMFIFFMTNLGRFLLMFGRESYIELKKVVWPTYRDTLNTTFVVVAVTIVLSLILWGLDSVLVRVISFGLRL